MSEVSIDEVQTHLSRLLKQFALGEEIIIAESGKPVARLVPYEAQMQNRTQGLDAGLVEVAEDFDAPLIMTILLDTHCWLWWIAAPSRLNEKARNLIVDHLQELQRS